MVATGTSIVRRYPRGPKMKGALASKYTHQGKGNTNKGKIEYVAAYGTDNNVADKATLTLSMGVLGIKIANQASNP